MSTTDPSDPQESFTSPGAIAAIVVLIAVLLVGGWYFFSGRGADDQGSVRPGPEAEAEEPPNGDTPPSSGPADPERDQGEGCSKLPASDDQRPPESAEWLVRGGLQVPTHPDLGPVNRDAGMCFAHSPMGAVTGALWFIADLVGASDRERVYHDRLVPNRGQTLALAALEGGTPPPATRVECQPAGYRIISASSDSVVMQLAAECSSTEYSITEITMRWYEGDWRVELNDEGSTGQDSRAEQLNGFTEWSAS